jgi:hypothetical protein
LYYNQGITRPDIRIKVLFVTSVDVGNSNIVIYVTISEIQGGTIVKLLFVTFIIKKKSFT